METESTTFHTTEMDYTGSGDSDYHDIGGTPCSKDWVRHFSRSYEPILFMLIFVLGTVGNVLVVLVTGNRLKTMTDVYLLNLAVADLLFLATLPFWAVNAWQGWVFGSHAVGLCKAVVVVYKLNIFSSMLLLACISVDRYVAIVQVTRAHNLCRERRMLYSRVACVAVWLLSSLLAVPEMLFAKVRDTEGVQPVCDTLPGTDTRTKVLVLCLQVCVGFLLPLGVMGACYSFILRSLLQARSFHKHKALRVILAVVVVFVLSQLPYNGHLVTQASQFGNDSMTSCAAVVRVDVFGQLAKGLAYTHACLNPFLYVFVGVRFRRDLLRLMKLCAGRLGAGQGQAAPGAKRPSVMSDTETTGALSL